MRTPSEDTAQTGPEASPGKPPPPALMERLAAVECLVLDVDGVLTDGKLYYGADGEALKVFHVHDGLGIRLLRQQGIRVAVISAKASEALVRRLRDLEVDHTLLGRSDKSSALKEMGEKLRLPPSQCAFVGDDLLDLPAMGRAGVAISVANGHPLVRARADWVTQREGGLGAVREICDTLLEARGELVSACRALLGEDPWSGTR